MPLFHAFGRVGCFLAGCCYGKKLERTITILNGIRLERIPIQLIEAIFEFLLFIILTVIRKKDDNVNILRIYLMSYSAFRFLDEFFRGDEIRGIFFGLSTAQWISLVIWAVYILKAISGKKETRSITR